MNGQELESGAALNHWLRVSLVVGSIALIAGIVGGVYAPTEFFQAYLFSYVFLLGLPLGALALLMIYHLAGGVWGLLIRRIVEAEMRTMPLIAILFVPIGFGLPHIYSWANPLVEAADTRETLRGRYLEPAFFGWRAVCYFLVWLGLAGMLSVWSRQHDKTGDVRTAWKSYKLSGVGLVLFGVALHFAAVDWIMSLQPEFTSTIFGPLVFSGQILSAFAAAVLALCLLSERREYEDLLSAKVLNDLGSLLFTLLVLWAYLAWFQYMLIWMADLPRGSSWYLLRVRGGWDWITLALVVFHFAIPFFLLLFRGVKRRPNVLAAVAALILVMQLVFDYYQVMPSYDEPVIGGGWMSVVLPIGLCGLWLANFLWSLARRPLLPLHDFNLLQAVHLRDLEEDETAREEVLAHG
jgi:hypothetical protein